ncbi:MAG: zinc ribbon domain-containing protein [Clostridiales bacterium]|nr:zinc ribbon domain-containing protein [Clostridiales bacterium]MCD8325069.1 zinc ribbon domain-containing protein [Clostridiales bacterium]MCD8332524.1 zinc ribbon domain-containing protein [Clostridiales bacterium]
MASMDFFNRIGNTISAAGKDGMAKAKELKDTAKISVDIKEREGAIQKMYRELGKAYYHDHRDDADGEYEDRIAAIKAAFEEIGELKASKDDLRGIKRCPDCGHPVAPNAKFCGNCGAKCEEEVVECEVVDDDAEETAEETEAAEETADEVVEETEETEDAAAEESAEGEAEPEKTEE